MEDSRRSGVRVRGLGDNVVVRYRCKFEGLGALTLISRGLLDAPHATAA